MKIRNVIKFLLLAQMSMVLAGCGRIDIQIPEEGLTIELGEELPADISEYVTAESYEEISVHTEDVDVFSAGTYTVPVYYKDKEVGTLQVTVEDSTAPEAKLKENIRLESGTKMTADDCVEEVSDNSETEVWFLIDSLRQQDEPEAECNLEEANLSKQLQAPEDGSYQVQLLVRDAFDNYNVYVLCFETFTPDTEAPVITAENKTVEYGKEPDYMSGVSAVDNVDGDLTESIELDTSQVDIYMAGQYSVTYTVSDAAGNQGKKEIIVTVKQKAVPVQETTASGSQASGYTALSVEDAVEIKTEGGEQTGGNVIVQPQQQPAEEVPDIPQTPETPAAASGFDTGKADELLVLVNAERQARGLGAVTAKDSLTERAKERAQSGNGSGSGVILCRGTGATSASIVVDTWNRDWPEGTWMTEAWKYAGAACYNDGGTYTWVVVFGAY